MVVTIAQASIRASFITTVGIFLTLLGSANKAHAESPKDELLASADADELAEAPSSQAQPAQGLANRTIENPFQQKTASAATREVSFSNSPPLVVQVSQLSSLEIEQISTATQRPQPPAAAVTYGVSLFESASAAASPRQSQVQPQVQSQVQPPISPKMQTLAAQSAGQFTSQSVSQSLDDTFSPQSESDIRQQLLIDPALTPADINTGTLDRPRAVPASNFLTPSAYGADWGDAYIGIAGATVDNDREFDGSISLGVGLGNAVKNVGVELSVGIISLEGFAEDGVVGAKIHKVFPRANNLALAVGWANPVKWGAAEREEDTFYGVATQQYNLRPGKVNPVPLTASVGVGTGTFRSLGAIAADDNAPNVFGSLGLRVIPEVSVATSWTGSALGLALSTAPFDAPLVITAGVADLTDNTADGTQFVGSVGYSLGF